MIMLDRDVSTSAPIGAREYAWVPFRFVGRADAEVENA
jgi:hypothetical protein